MPTRPQGAPAGRPVWYRPPPVIKCILIHTFNYMSGSLFHSLETTLVSSGTGGKVELKKNICLLYKMSYDYAVRLQALDGYQAKFDDVFGDRFSRLIYVHHTGKKGDNPHYHFCLTCDYNNRDTLSRYLKRHFTLSKGNKHISVKNWDGNPDACAYLFHEDTPVTNVRGFTDEEYKQFFTRNEQVKKSQVKLPVLLERVMTNILGHEMYVLNGHYSKPNDERRMIFMEIMKEIRRTSDWVPNRFQMERYINKVRLMLNNSDVSFKLFCSELYEEYFGRF